MRAKRIDLLMVTVSAVSLLMASPTAGEKTSFPEAWKRIRSLIRLGIKEPEGDPFSPAITGTKVIKKEELQKLIGLPPSGSLEAKRSWAREALHQILTHYRSRGYTRARAWEKIDRKGRVHIDIDEGRIQLVFIGAGTFTSFLYRIDLLPPDRIYHRPTVLQGLAELKRKYNLASIYHRVIFVDPPLQNQFGQPVPQQELRVYVISREFFGWTPKISISSSWGIVPAIKYTTKSVAFEDDRFAGELELAVPFRRFFYEQDPQFQWVHGLAQVTFRFPRLFHETLAPEVESSTSISRFASGGQQLESYIKQQTNGLVGLLVLLPAQLSVKVSAGLDHVWAFDLGWRQNTSLEQQKVDRDRTHFLTLLEVTKTFDRRVLRLDQRDLLKLRLTVSMAGASDLLIDVRFWSQFVLNFSGHDLIVRAHGVMLHGDLRFWDEAQLANNYMRCYFGNRYSVHEVLQGSIAFRLRIVRWFKIGVFHDTSGFFDLTRSGEPLSAATAFGPGLHFLLFDLFSLDVHYAFGFAPVGFDHNISFSMQRAF